MERYRPYITPEARCRKDLGAPFQLLTFRGFFMGNADGIFEGEELGKISTLQDKKSPLDKITRQDFK